MILEMIVMVVIMFVVIQLDFCEQKSGNQELAFADVKRHMAA